jgi:hypothetical protein
MKTFGLLLWETNADGDYSGDAGRLRACSSTDYCKNATSGDRDRPTAC